MQLARARQAVERTRLRKHAGAIDERPRPHLFVALGDALEAGGGERFRSDFARLEAPCGIGDRKFI